MAKIAIAFVLGLVVGIAGQYYLFMGAYSLVPWGIIGLVLGWVCRDTWEAALAGFTYGFTLSFSFMIAGYAGTAPLLGRLPFFAILGLFGAVCGLLAALVGVAAKRTLAKRNAEGQ